MANDITQVEEVWDTGATKVVSLTWQHLGRLNSCPYPASVLPDYSGDMVVEYDWQTGQLLRWTRSPWLRY